MNIFSKWFGKKDNRIKGAPSKFTQRVACGGELTMDELGMRVIAPNGATVMEVLWAPKDSGEFARFRCATEENENNATLALFGPGKSIPRAAIGNPH